MLRSSGTVASSVNVSLIKAAAEDLDRVFVLTYCWLWCRRKMSPANADVFNQNTVVDVGNGDVVVVDVDIGTAD